MLRCALKEEARMSNLARNPAMIAMMTVLLLAGTRAIDSQGKAASMILPWILRLATC